jgi:hypothetical protein
MADVNGMAISSSIFQEADYKGPDGLGGPQSLSLGISRCNPNTVMFKTGQSKCVPYQPNLPTQ